MSLEDFHIIKNGPVYNSLVKRDFLQVYHQQGAQLKDPNQSMAFIFGEKKIIIKLVMLILNFKKQ